MPQQPGSSLVSIIIPAFNAERFIARAIRSALAQTYPHLEVIVVDDGSTDATANVVRGFADPRLRCLSQSNQGQGAARNLGIRASTGNYVTFLDADDVYLPEKVERQVEFLTARQECEIVFCDALHFYARRPAQLLARKTPRRVNDMFQQLLRASIVNPNTLMVPGETLRGGFFFREERYYPEEWDLCLRLARAGHRFAHQETPLVIVELRSDSNTTMAIQWRLKRHTVEMFERLFAEMSREDRARYGADEVLRSSRRRLAVSALISADPPRALAASAPDLPPPMTALMKALLRFVPPPVLRAALIAAWRLRQRLNLTPVRASGIDAAWARIRAVCD